ncbi:UNVERIFIED_ORG: hypothetical protein ABIB13_002204 [Arthrobacter sp. UYEF2]
MADKVPDTPPPHTPEELAGRIARNVESTMAL